MACAHLNGKYDKFQHRFIDLIRIFIQIRLKPVVRDQFSYLLEMDICRPVFSIGTSQVGKLGLVRGA